MKVAEGCIPEQNRPLVPILASAKAVDTAIIDDFWPRSLNAAQRRANTR
ncbi:hypothetical protein THAOC_12363, partial [Thalassiosira oceanica]